MRCALLIALLLCLPSLALAAFTVDDRSALHFGVSTGIGYTLNSLAIAAQGSKLAQQQSTERQAFVFAACMAPGLAKEYLMDAQADAGDLFFNALGCGASIALSDYLWVAPTGNGVALGGRWP
jgi:hypothetical protein